MSAALASHKSLSPPHSSQHRNAFHNTCIYGLRRGLPLVEMSTLPVAIFCCLQPQHMAFDLWFVVRDILPCLSYSLDWMIARTSILSVLDGAINIGHLTISDSEGVHCYGTRHKGCNDVYIKVVNDYFWTRLLL